MRIRGTKTLWIRIPVRVLFIASLIILSIRDYLFGNGLYIYRDWTWPLSNSLTPIANFSPGLIRNSGPDPMGFVRMFLTWPIIIIDEITSSPVLAEKIYVVYLFSVFSFVFFILAELLARALQTFGGRTITPWKRELFVLSTVLLCFINFWSLEQLSDLYFTYVIELALIGISMILSITEINWIRSTILPGALLGICVFLDPNLYPFGLISVAVTILAGNLLKAFTLKQLSNAFQRMAIVIAVSVPPLVTMLLVFSMTTGTNLRPADNYQTAGANLSLTNALRLIGYWWSLLVYSPPSVVNTNATSEIASVGAPPYMLTPPGGISLLWSIATWTLPVMALGTGILSHVRKLTIPFAAVGITGILFTQPSIFPLPYLLATQTRGIPLIGGALVTFLAIPDHALIVAAISFILLACTGLYGVLVGDPVGRVADTLGFKKRSHFMNVQARKRQIGLTLFLIGLLVFSGWQFFSGSFFPSSYVWGGTGNGVSSVGSFSPSQPPDAMLQVYDWLLSQPGHFNIYWPGPSGSSYPWSPKATGNIAWQDAPKPTVFPKALPYLMSSGLTADIKGYLASLDVRYLVVQPFDPMGMQFDWGVRDAGTVNSILQSVPGVHLVHSFKDLTIYEVDGVWGTLYSSSVVAGYNATDSRYAIAYGISDSLNARIAVTDSTTIRNNLCIDQVGCSFSIISPGKIAIQTAPHTSIFGLNQTPTFWQDFVLQGEASAWMLGPSSPWTVTNWGQQNATIGVINATMHWNFDHGPTYLTLSYNGTVTDHNAGGLSIPPNKAATTQIQVWYRTSAGFNGALQIVVPELNRTGNVITESISENFPASTDWQLATYYATLPFDTAYFTSRFAAQSSGGTLELRNARIDLSVLPRNPSAPFGFTLPLPENLTFEFPQSQTLVQFQGTGSILSNGHTFALDSPDQLAWWDGTEQPTSKMQFSRDVTISALLLTLQKFQPQLGNNSIPNEDNDSIVVSLTSNVIYSRIYAQGYALSSVASSFSPLQTMDGLNLFVGVSPGIYTVSVAKIGIVQVAYMASLGMIFGIIVAAFLPSLTLLFRRLTAKNKRAVESLVS